MGLLIDVHHYDRSARIGSFVRKYIHTYFTINHIRVIMMSEFLWFDYSMPTKSLFKGQTIRSNFTAKKLAK